VNIHTALSECSSAGRRPERERDLLSFGNREEVSSLEIFLEALARLLLVDFSGEPSAAPHRVFEKVEGVWEAKPLPRNPAAAKLVGGGSGKAALETKIFHNASFSTRPPVKGRIWEPPPWSPDGGLENRVHLVVADRYVVGFFGRQVWVVRDCTTVVLREHSTSYIQGVAKLLSEVKRLNVFAPRAKTLNPKLELFLEKFERDQAQLKPKPKPKTKPKPKPRQRQGQGRRQRRNNNRR
tara:strand:+ start:4207 stop:4920 length:714 start_codon:yes stop_codon:yes gene_type:complete